MMAQAMLISCYRCRAPLNCPPSAPRLYQSLHPWQRRSHCAAATLAVVSNDQIRHGIVARAVWPFLSSARAKDMSCCNCSVFRAESSVSRNIHRPSMSAELTLSSYSTVHLLIKACSLVCSWGSNYADLGDLVTTHCYRCAAANYCS
jgi:hypothetical protein